MNNAPVTSIARDQILKAVTLFPEVPIEEYFDRCPAVDRITHLAGHLNAMFEQGQLQRRELKGRWAYSLSTALRQAATIPWVKPIPVMAPPVCDKPATNPDGTRKGSWANLSPEAYQARVANMRAAQRTRKDRPAGPKLPQAAGRAKIEVHGPPIDELIKDMALPVLRNAMMHTATKAVLDGTVSPSLLSCPVCALREDGSLIYVMPDGVWDELPASLVAQIRKALAV